MSPKGATYLPWFSSFALTGLRLDVRLIPRAMPWAKVDGPVGAFFYLR